MEDNSVIKEGYVFVHRQQTREMETCWVKKHCVLHKETELRTAYLELGEQSGNPRGIEIADITFNDDRSGDKCCIQVEVISKKQKYLLKPPEDDLLDWLFKLTLENRGRKCRRNDSNVSEKENIRFQRMITSLNQAMWYGVKLLETDLAKYCDIVGKNILIICKGMFRLIRPSLEGAQSFQFSWVKRIHHKFNTIDVELGKQSKIGEGVLKFESEYADVLYRIIRVLRQFNRQDKELTCTGINRTSKGENVGDLPWFHESVSRENVTQLFNDRRNGSFLVRRSESTPGDFVLSFLHTGLLHLKISTKQGKYNILGMDRRFDSLQQIVSELTENSFQLTTADRVELKLKLPISNGSDGDKGSRELEVELGDTCHLPDRRRNDRIREDLAHELFLHELDLDKAHEKKLTSKEYNTLSMVVGQGWEHIGFQLGLDVVELDHIKMDHATVVKQILYMLLKWEMNENGDARLDVLVKSILECPSVTVKWTTLWNLLNGL